jgi:hypothetical protein
LTFAIAVDANGVVLPAVPTPGRSGATRDRRFAPLCLTPCEVRLPPGTYALGIADEGEKSVPVARPLVLDRDTTVVGQYHANGWRRGLGIAVIASAVLISGAIFLSSPARTCAVDAPPCDSGPSGTRVAIGAGILSVGAVSGILLIATGSNSASMIQQ